MLDPKPTVNFGQLLFLTWADTGVPQALAEPAWMSEGPGPLAWHRTGLHLLKKGLGSSLGTKQALGFGDSVTVPNL